MINSIPESSCISHLFVFHHLFIYFGKLSKQRLSCSIENYNQKQKLINPLLKTH